MGTFKNKVVVITGGNSGIGYATAKEFIAQDATVLSPENGKMHWKKPQKKLEQKQF
jgi:NAD(P)-dependent dehydrogenase (short-subunit alcohol dehydrogenase family)